MRIMVLNIIRPKSLLVVLYITLSTVLVLCQCIKPFLFVVSVFSDTFLSRVRVHGLLFLLVFVKTLLTSERVSDDVGIYFFMKTLLWKGR